MMTQPDSFDRLVNEAWNHPFSGWDFAYISGRMIEHPLSWDYRALVMEKFKTVQSLLDQDTGGGELLSSMQPLPPNTCATEGYPPNILVARARLEPLGVQVFGVSQEDLRMPFADSSFDLVINRHGSYLPSELYRILKPGKSFITQQVGSENNIGLNAVLQDRVEFEFSDLTAALLARQLEEAGFEIVDRREEFPITEFKDIGAVVYHLKVICWQISDFTPEKYADRLRKIHERIQRDGNFVIASHRFYIEAQKK